MSTSKKFAVKNGLDSAGDVLVSGHVVVNTTPSAWNTTARAIQMGTGGALWNYSTTQLNMSQGLYYDSTNYKYLNTGVAVAGISLNSGALYFQQAGTGTVGATPTLTTSFVIDTNGSVGIGTGTPSAGYKLHIQGSGSTASLIQSTGSTSGQVGWNIKNDAAATATFSMYNSTQTAFGAVGSGEAFLYANSPGLTICTDTAGAPIKFATGTSNAERMRIDASGNVGVGITSAGSRVHINNATLSGGILTLQGNNNYTHVFSSETATGSVAGARVLLTSNSTSGEFSYANSGGERLRITSSGNLALGVTTSTWDTTNALRAIDFGVTGSLYSTNASTASVILGNNIYVSGGAFLRKGADYASYYLQNSGSHQFFVTNAAAAPGTTPTFTQAFTVANNGNVGVGSISPSYKFQIQNAATTATATPSFSAVINRQNSTTEGLQFGIDGNTDAVIAANNSNLRIGKTVTGAFTELMRLDTAGNVLRGATSSVFGGDQTGYVNSNGTQVGIWGTSSNYSGTFIGTYSNHSFGLLTNNATRLLIDVNGNIGVNTTPTANARLDINGTVAQNITAISALNMDLSAGSYFTKTVSGATAFTVSNIPASRYVSWLLKLTNGGSATVTWPTGTKWNGGTAPTLTAAGIDIISFFTDDGGTTIHAFLVSKDSK